MRIPYSVARTAAKVERDRAAGLKVYDDR